MLIAWLPHKTPFEERLLSRPPGYEHATVIERERTSMMGMEEGIQKILWLLPFMLAFLAVLRWLAMDPPAPRAAATERRRSGSRNSAELDGRRPR